MFRGSIDFNNEHLRNHKANVRAHATAEPGNSTVLTESVNEGIDPAHVQLNFDVCCEWGLQGMAALAPTCDILVVIDVLSFTTCVDVATANGASVVPYRSRDDSAHALAVKTGALLASSRDGEGFSLSPTSLLKIPAGVRLVLPSPNGATISLAAPHRRLLAGCLRNASAIAHFAARHGSRVAVIPCGERWPDGSLRPALEDWLGAGAVIAALGGSKSPEAILAESTFREVAGDLSELVGSCASGRELIERGFATDVELASQYDCSDVVPVLEDGEYQADQSAQ